MCVAVLGVSCFSGKEVQGEIPEEIAQLVAVVSGPRCEQLLGAVAVGRWLLQEPGTLSCHPKRALHGHWVFRALWVREPQVLQDLCHRSELWGSWLGPGVGVCTGWAVLVRQLLSAWKRLRADLRGKNMSDQGSCHA